MKKPSAENIQLALDVLQRELQSLQESFVPEDNEGLERVVEFLTSLMTGPRIQKGFLACPTCEKQHVDRNEWATRPHHKHLCEHCGTVWRIEPYMVGVTSKMEPQ